MSIRMCIVSDIATHSLLGGQHGEESQESEEGQEGEEEAVDLLLPDDAIDSDVESSVADRRGRRFSAMLRMATPASDDDGGRRRNRVHPSRILVFCSDFTGRLSSRS